MNSADFTYWLQGFVELQESDSISDKQWLVIKDHLKLVFDKKTPNRSLELTPVFDIKRDVGLKDYRGISDLIGKESNWPSIKYPYTTITC